MKLLNILFLLILLPFNALAASYESIINESALSPELAFILNNSAQDLNYNYEQIDIHALNSPASVESSIESLAAYLVKPARNDREKARSIYRWITENIDYNVEGFFARNLSSMKLRDLLENRISVCSGYSDLFQSLASEAGLEAVKISGYGKGYGYQPGKNFSGFANHAWNAVKIDGSWYLIDCTWGAGFINEDGKYVREFDEHYFMTAPSEFIYDHFPEDSRWQLLNNPLSKAEFEHLAYLEPEFFNYGLKISRLSGIIKADREVNISIFVPNGILLMARLEYEEEESSKARANQVNYVLCERDGNRYDVLAQFPKSGKYILSAFARKEDEPGDFHKVIEYGIEAVAENKESIGFPMTYGKFTEERAYLYSPINGTLKAGRSYWFKIMVPNARDVAVICGKEWSYLNSNGDLFEGNVTVDKGDVLVSANFLGESYDGLLKYVAI